MNWSDDMQHSKLKMLDDLIMQSGKIDMKAVTEDNFQHFCDQYFLSSSVR